MKKFLVFVFLVVAFLVSGSLALKEVREQNETINMQRQAEEAIFFEYVAEDVSSTNISYAAGSMHTIDITCSDGREIVEDEEAEIE